MAQTKSATQEGTARYRDRFRSVLAEEHFGFNQGLWMSSIGLGTYLGTHNRAADVKYRDAIVQATQKGCNVIDTAINYRFQRSERSIGEALDTLFENGKALRDEIVIATKGGYIPFDSSPPGSSGEMLSYIEESFIKPGIIEPNDMVAGCHCMTPGYIENQLECSLRNLRLECIDIYYLHNTEEQLKEVSRKEYRERMRAAFEFLEESVRVGKIRMFGTATWNGFRQPPDAPDYMSLEDLVDLAEEVGGESHHFKVIQLPYNLAMPEALAFKNQKVEGEMISILEAAWHFGTTVVASSSLLQSQLARNLPDFIGECLGGLETDAQRAIQFVRSTPGIAVSLVGMSSTTHVEENMKTAKLPPAPLEDFMRLFGISND